MKLPESRTIVEIEHRGQRVHAVVDDVQPDSTSPLFYWVTLQVDGDFHRGEQCYWITQGDAKVPAAVHQVASQHGITKIQLRAIIESDEAHS